MGTIAESTHCSAVQIPPEAELTMAEACRRLGMDRPTLSKIARKLNIPFRIRGQRRGDSAKLFTVRSIERVEALFAACEARNSDIVIEVAIKHLPPSVQVRLPR